MSHPNFSVTSLDLPSSLYSFSSFPSIVMLKIGFLFPEDFQNSELHHCYSDFFFSDTTHSLP